MGGLYQVWEVCGCRVPEECPQEIKELITRCLSTDPSLRPDSKEIYTILKASSETIQPSKKP